MFFPPLNLVSISRWLTESMAVYQQDHLHHPSVHKDYYYKDYTGNWQDSPHT